MADDIGTRERGYLSELSDYAETVGNLRRQLQDRDATIARIEAVLKYMADEHNWSIEDGQYQMKRPGGSERSGIFLSSHFLCPWILARQALAEQQL